MLLSFGLLQQLLVQVLIVLDSKQLDMLEKVGEVLGWPERDLEVEARLRLQTGRFWPDGEDR